jgi:hypothetical protein
VPALNKNHALLVCRAHWLNRLPWEFEAIPLAGGGYDDKLVFFHQKKINDNLSLRSALSFFSFTEHKVHTQMMMRA